MSESEYYPSDNETSDDLLNSKTFFIYCNYLNIEIHRRERYGDRVDGPWIFGLALCKVEANGKRTLKEVRYFYVERRNMETLTPIILREVIKGSTISSDEWKAYNNISSLGYNHIKINHSVNYVIDGQHTNTIEACWGRLKTKILRIKRGVSSKYLIEYLIEEWFRSIMGSKIKLLNNLFREIKYNYH